MYAPQLLLISAGFDAHAEDPLAECRVTEDGYGEMARSLRALAAELGVPVGAVLEGGYALDALARSVAVTMGVLAGVDVADGSVGVAEVSGQALERLGEFWPGLT
jgi:acetoin utilization deacetylase AcuC-like enzyme